MVEACDDIGGVGGPGKGPGGSPYVARRGRAVDFHPQRNKLGRANLSLPAVKEGRLLYEAGKEKWKKV